MNRCPITYQLCEEKYSIEGLQHLSPDLRTLDDFPYTPAQQLELLLEYSDRLSFSGVQPKMSIRLNVQKNGFEPVQREGTFILKLPRTNYPQLPENEDLTMRLAGIAGIDVPFHGMVYATDGSLLYFVERFDRRKNNAKVFVEDVSQLAALSTREKYDFTMEKVAALLDALSSSPQAEKQKLFRLTLFNFLVGNEDMHAKNFSLLRNGDLRTLSPAYDLVNSTIALHNATEEIALTLRGKKSNLRRNDFVKYFGKERLDLPESVISEVLERLHASLPLWHELIGISFLSDERKEKYLHLLKQRSTRLFA